MAEFDSVIIGGGFYGCALSLLLARHGQRVLIVERSGDLMRRASYVNQARVHQGYHYPRNFVTAQRSCANFPHFIEDFRPAVQTDFEKIYAIARLNSKVTAQQFEAVCRKIGAPVAQAAATTRRLFSNELIEAVFQVREVAFNAAIIREMLKRRLYELRISVRLDRHVERIFMEDSGELRIACSTGEGYRASNVFVCAYAAINTLLGDSGLPRLPMKHEITEQALVRHAPPLDRMGITVMDGAFFSTMPFPDRNAHSFTHVRYTPHLTWSDAEEPRDAYPEFERYRPISKFPLMIKDAQRYLPLAGKAEHLGSLYEVKTVLTQNEENDGRPICFRRNYGHPGLSVIMGGKIDNIYDLLSAVHESLDGAPARGIDYTFLSTLFRIAGA